VVSLHIGSLAKRSDSYVTLGGIIASQLLQSPTDPNHPDNAIIFASQPFLNMTQYTRDEVTGKNCRFLQGAERDQPEVEKLRKAMFNAEPVVVQLRNFRKDGTLFQNQLSMSPIFDNRKNLINFIGVQCVI
jgi:PAS domain S-box-containing protein